MKSRFFVASDGDMYKDDNFKKPFRDMFSYTFRHINTTAQLRATLRNGEYAWPGGYPMFLITSDGAALHFNCAKENYRSISDSIRHKLDDGWRVVACDINYEDGDLCCDDCSKHIESAYAEQESEDE